MVVRSNNTSRGKICIVATVPLSLKAFMRVHIEVLSKEYDITLVTNGLPGEMAELLGEHVSFVPLRIERKISLKADIRALVELCKLFYREKFDSIHSIMPKSGLLSMLAGRIVRIPLRFHTFTGQVWATKRGFSRFVLKSLDKVLASNATHLLADSPSQRLFLIENNIVKPQAIDVLADGSFGVDLTRFALSSDARRHIRSVHNIPDTAVVFLFLGRLNLDKGLMDLSRAFRTVAASNRDAHLLIVGLDEGGLDIEFSRLAQQIPGRVHRVGFIECPESYMSAADVFCLPSYREGFGAVIIEAASVGLPAVASRIYGITDAVEDGVTGILHKPAADFEIADAMLLLATNHALRQQMGNAARARAIAKFSEARVTAAMADFYRRFFGFSHA